MFFHNAQDAVVKFINNCKTINYYPRIYIAHHIDDGVVGVQNTLSYIKSLLENGYPLERVHVDLITKNDKLITVFNHDIPYKYNFNYVSLKNLINNSIENVLNEPDLGKKRDSVTLKITKDFFEQVKQMTLRT
jgi:hypothetical protein